MPKFLAGCHYNEKEISRHLKENIGYWLVQMNGNKIATGQILEKPVEVVKGRISAGWAQKAPEPVPVTTTMMMYTVYIYTNLCLLLYVLMLWVLNRKAM